MTNYQAGTSYPIETVPTDGRYILVFSPRLIEYHLDWDKPYPATGWTVDRVQQGWPDKEIHWQNTYSADYTYWQPMPGSPEESNSEN